MVTTLDRYIARQFGLNYVISFSVLVSLYVVLDLFFNLDEFYQGTDLGIVEIAIAVAKYYATHLFWYFSQISGVITLFAMAFTLARMQRDNEFVAIISSGVSLYRIALTVIVLGVALNGLWLVDQELIIPRLAPKLAQTHKAVALNKPYEVWFLQQKDGSLLSALQFDHKSGVLRDVLIIPSSADQFAETIIDHRRCLWPRHGVRKPGPAAFLCPPRRARRDGPGALRLRRESGGGSCSAQWSGENGPGCCE